MSDWKFMTSNQSGDGQLLMTSADGECIEQGGRAVPIWLYVERTAQDWYISTPFSSANVPFSAADSPEDAAVVFLEEQGLMAAA